MLPILRDDALVSADDGVTLRLCLPWIRSLPLAGVAELEVEIDGEPVDVLARVDGRTMAPEDLTEQDGWWFVQDRLLLESRRTVGPGIHQVSVSFRLVIPNLDAGPDGPLILPFHAHAELRTGSGTRRITRNADAARAEVRFRPDAPKSGASDAAELPDGWTIGASSFNWTPDVIAADQAAPDIAVAIVTEGVADVIEVELGQLWRSFPDIADAEADALRSTLDSVGGSASIVGASIDDWRTAACRRTDDERLAFLMPQLRAARRLGAHGVRLPIGQAGPRLLQRLQPALEDLDLVLFEEVQGHQTPENPAVAAAYETIARLDDPRIRLLVDTSMLMPALPVTYLALLRDGAVPASFVDALEADWRSPAIDAEVVALLRSGRVPPAMHTAYMNLLVRFGRTDAANLRSILPLTGAFHLKFWDLDDADGRVTQPIRDLGALLARHEWRGSLTSEWGGHEWLDDAPTETTRRHLRLARTALAQGAQNIPDPKENSWLTPSAT